MGLLSSLVGGILSRNSASRARKNSIEDMQESLPRLRESAERAGFNPLTALLANGGSGFTQAASGAAPLASIEMLTSGLSSVGDILSGQKAKDDARQKTIDDLDRLRLEQAKAGKAGFSKTRTVIQSTPRPSAASSIPAVSGVSNIGNNSRSASPVSVSEGWLTPDREQDRLPVTDSPGAFKIDNALTDGPIWLPGDGDPWGIDELGTAVVVGVPQMAYKGVKKIGGMMTGDYDYSKSRLHRWTGGNSNKPAPAQKDDPLIQKRPYISSTLTTAQ